jgi:hypothetical protein
MGVRGYPTEAGRTTDRAGAVLYPVHAAVLSREVGRGRGSGFRSTRVAVPRGVRAGESGNEHRTDRAGAVVNPLYTGELSVGWERGERKRLEGGGSVLLFFIPFTQVSLAGGGVDNGGRGELRFGAVIFDCMRCASK